MKHLLVMRIAVVGAGSWSGTRGNTLISLTKRWWFRLGFLALYGVWGLAAPAGASPIKYQLIVPTATVQIASQSYANVQVTFTFVGDDTNVISGTTPSGIVGIPEISYSAIYQGVASVTVTGPAGVLTSAVFLPNQIVVTVDHYNEGVGFGFVPGGISPSGFDVTQLQPLYPVGISDYESFPGVVETSRGWNGYDLTLAYAQSHTLLGAEFHADGSVDILAPVYSCNQFGGSIFVGGCAIPTPIQTNLGAFTIDAIFEPTTVGTQGRPLYIGEFTASPAQVQSLVTFSAFNADLEISGGGTERFEVIGRFTLGAASNGINPLTEPVTLQLGTSSLSIPNGSFTKNARGQYTFRGTIGGVTFDALIAPSSQNAYRFAVDGRGANLSGTPGPVAVGLTIGDDTGTTSAKVESE